MPLRTIRVFISFLFITLISTLVFAQTEPNKTTLAELKKSPPKTPTSAEIMRNRISKAKALLVIKNYGAAIYELENIKRETGDKTVRRVLNVLLMHAYLEQGDYIKAQKFLKGLHKPTNTNSSMDYLAVAGQVVSGAKTQLERYKSLGLSVSDRNLPKEASSDIDNMRKTLELVITQSRDLGKNKKVAANAFALLEETTSARSNLAKDAYDAKRWENQLADAREELVNPNSKVIYSVENPPINAPNPDIVDAKDIKLIPQKVPDSNTVAEKTNTEEKSSLKPVADNKTTNTQPKENTEDVETKKALAENTVAKNEPVKTEENKTKNALSPTDRKIRIIPSAKRTDSEKTDKKETPKLKSTDQEPKKEAPKKSIENNVAKVINDGSPLPVGSLISYATKRVNPVYPRQARSMRMTGTVTVEVVIDEDGKVKKVENTKGPSLLKRAARDAVRKWRFKPFERDGQPVQAKGFVSFNFNL